MLPRFFVEPEEIVPTKAGYRVQLAGEDVHHIHRVLRLRPGDAVWVADGTGRDFPGELETADRQQATIRLDPPIPSAGEPTYRITLFQGLPKADKMDWVVQKATEVGVHQVIPVTTERSVIALSAAKAVGRAERWRRIASAAAKQAARGRVPGIAEPTGMDDALSKWCESAPGGLLVVPWEEEGERGLRRVLQSAHTVPRDIGVVIGPEGGLTSDETRLAAEMGGITCTLGPRILRTETAGPVVAALILYELGEMGG